MIIGFYRFRFGKLTLKTNKPKRNSKDGFTPRPCKVKPFGFLKKIFLSSLRSKRVFFPKNLACRSVYALCFAFLFSFFRFFFFRGASLFAALCSAHHAPHRRAPTAPTKPPHTRTATTPPPDTLAPGSRWRTGSDRQPTNSRPRHRPQSIKFGRAFRTDGAAIAEPSQETENDSQWFGRTEKQNPFLVVSQ